MSDPSAIQLPVHQALTSDMMLGLKPSAPKSRSYRINVAPLNQSTFSGGSQMIFELPTGRKGTWLDQSQSYLKFSVQCTATAACAANVTTNTAGGFVPNGIYVENSAYSFIQRMDLYHSSNLLESISEYGQLANFLMDTSLTQSDKAGLSALLGTNPLDTTVGSITTPGAGFVNGTTYSSTTLQYQRPGDRSGLSMSAVINTAAITTAIPYTFTLPVLSGVIGVNASKMLPVGKLASPVRCEFYLSPNDDAIFYGVAGAGAVWQICNAELCVCYVELQDDSVEQIIPQGATEYISTKTYRQSSTYLPAATSGEFTTLVPIRCASLCSIFARFRPYATAAQGVAASAAYRKSASINPNFSSYYWRIGSSIYPNKPVYLINGTNVGTGAEGFAELIKSFHALSSSIGNSAMTHTMYNVAATATQGWTINAVPSATSLGTHTNAFGIGLELESFSNRGDTILSGVSTLNSQVYFTAVVNNGVNCGGTNNCNYTCDFFSQLDMILCITDGVMSAKF